MLQKDDKLNNDDGLSEFPVLQWLKKRKFLKEDRIQLKDQIEFAKKLFYSWDDDGSGVLEIDEISEPLIALGLAPGKEFVFQLIKSLDPKFLKYEFYEDAEGNGDSANELSVTLRDFLKIFRSDRLK